MAMHDWLRKKNIVPHAKSVAEMLQKVKNKTKKKDFTMRCLRELGRRQVSWLEFSVAEKRN